MRTKLREKVPNKNANLNFIAVSSKSDIRDFPVPNTKIIEPSSTELQGLPDSEIISNALGVSNQLFSERFVFWVKNRIKNSNDLLENEFAKEFNILRTILELRRSDLSVAEFCLTEHISNDTFINWSRSVNDFKQYLYSGNEEYNSIYTANRNFVVQQFGNDIFEFLENYMDFYDKSILIINNRDGLNMDSSKKINFLFHPYRINDIRFINKHFESVNSILADGGVFAGCVETFTARSKRKKINNIPVIGKIYSNVEFLLKRVIPKLSFSKKYYFDITKGHDRYLSKAETLGRLVSCGFSIKNFKSINGFLYFVVKKVQDPHFDMNPSYGPLYKMPRVGRNGKTIGVYKFRTMHPYSEYLQDYIVKAHGYSKTGKPADDFRIPLWGKFMRRFWLDEIPQLINVMKGEMKLVGIRPVSKRYFMDIPKEMQKLRLTQKPGCIPPYVSLNRESNVMSVLRAEKDYLEEKIVHPYSTDLKYFIKAIINIVFKNKRSA